MADYRLPAADSISLSAQTADKLIAGKNGSIALAYLCLLRSGSTEPARLAADLSVSVEEAEKLLSAMADMGLVQVSGGKKEYNADDLTNAMCREEFRTVSDRAENLWGTPLTAEELKRLLYVYDGLKLPAEVILMLLSYFKNEVRRRYGPGRRLNMAKLEKLASEWKAQGIETVEAAEKYLRKKELAASLEGEYRTVLGIYDRRLTTQEQSYFDSWSELGFRGDAVEIAYERMLNNIHKVDFKYMDSIFLSWHAKGLHAAEEIERGDPARNSRRTEQKPEEKQKQSAEEPSREEIERLRRQWEAMKEDS